MLQVLATAANGMAVESQKLDAIAATVASIGATPVAPAGSVAPVRIGALPVGDETLEGMASMREVETAYRLNAAVFATADEMLGTLLDVIQPESRSSTR